MVSQKGSNRCLAVAYLMPIVVWPVKRRLPTGLHQRLCYYRRPVGLGAPRPPLGLIILVLVWGCQNVNPWSPLKSYSQETCHFGRVGVNIRRSLVYGASSPDIAIYIHPLHSPLIFCVLLRVIVCPIHQMMYKKIK